MATDMSMRFMALNTGVKMYMTHKLLQCISFVPLYFWFCFRRRASRRSVMQQQMPGIQTGSRGQSHSDATAECTAPDWGSCRRILRSSSWLPVF